MNDKLDSLVRPQVRGFEPYLPGRSIESVKRELGLSRIIKLASNENALGPSPKAVRAMAGSGKGLFRYPDGASTRLRDAVARHAHVTSDRVIIGAGSDELIEILGKTYLNPGDSVVVSAHAFTRYKITADLMGADVITVPMKDFRHDLPAMAKSIKPNTKLVFIANPNNPTGTYNSAKELEMLLSHASTLSAKPLIVVDEAYYEYAKAFAPDYPNTLALQKQFDSLVVLRTFSKAHGLAGLRIGYGFADPAVIEALDRVRPPFNVSVAAQAAGEASLQDAAHIRKSVRLVESERKKVLKNVQKLGYAVLPSVGNFFLMDVSPRKGREVFEALLKRGIIVRSMEEYGFPQHVRVTYGLPAENATFIKILTEMTKR